MKVAIILPHFYPYVGGGEKMFYDLAKGLHNHGHEVRVVARQVAPDYVGEKIVDGVQVNYCDWKEMFGHPFPNKKDIEPVIKWCDVVHTSIFTTSPIVSSLARKHKKPSLLTIYEARGNKWYWCDTFIKATIFYIVEQFTCRQKFDCYHAISDATKRDIETFCKRKNVKRVYLANEMSTDIADKDFSMRKYFGVSEDTNVFLYYGRPGQTKGVSVYEKALEVLAEEKCVPDNTKFCFLLGKEPEDLRAAFVDLINKKGLDKYVIIKESVPRPALAACIMQADTVVVPSLTEGFGFSALEACQMGSNLIYSDGGSLPEVAFGKCKAFKNRDYNDLAEKIKAVINGSPDAFDDVPEKTFTYDEMLGGLMKLYEELLAR